MAHSAQSTVQQFLLFSSPRHHKSNGLIIEDIVDNVSTKTDYEPASPSTGCT